jgi:TIR domain
VGGAVPTPRRPWIFLSYRREDAAGHAGRLYDHLVERFGSGKVFMDRDAIRPGSDFTKVIKRALDECDVLVVLIGRRWLNCTDPAGRRRLDDPKDFVRLELETVLHRDAIIIPLLVEHTKMPHTTDLPSSISGLARRQALEISDRHWRRDVTVLCEELESLHKQEIAESQAEQDPGGISSSMMARLRRKTSGKIVALAAIVALLIAAGSLALTIGVRIGNPSEPVSAGTLARSIPVGVEPLGIEEGEGFVWTSNSGGTVSRIDPRDGTVVHIDVGGQPKDLKIGNGAVWVWNYLDAVTRIDVTTREVSAPIRSAVGPISGIAFGNGYVWLTHEYEGSVSRISATSSRSEGPPIKVGARLGGTVFGNRRLYVVDVDARALIAVDGATGRVLNDPLRLDHPLGGLQVYDGVIYVGSTDGVTPVDETTFVVGDLIPLKDAGLFEVGGGSLWVSYPLENVLRRFSLATSTQQGEPITRVGKGLGQTLFTAGLLWATKPGEDTVVRVRPART